jgi:subtilase family serine protease
MVVPNATPAGYGPADIRSAYNLTGSSTATVAIVDAYNDPTAETDLTTYRNQFGLSPCTTANGCFKKINQTGGTAYPRTNGGWAQEISLDLDMVSAACPGCHILLVEATSNSFANLAAGVTYAATKVPGVVAISNSYGGSDSAETSAYNHPGIAITASTGDGGYGVESPASYPHVVAVGGTSLRRASTSRGWTETAWSGAGSGCSTINAKPSWQTTATQCNGKANADVSAVADPNTGVAVYDSTSYRGSVGWLVFGGTSASSPIIASVYAQSGNTAGYPASYTWAHTSSLNDVTSGSNGTCSPSVWCHAGTGWDGPTGLGTPNGTAGF